MKDQVTAKAGPKTAYAAPQLRVYGAMKHLTAAGSGTTQEFLCFNDPSMSFGLKATNTMASVRC